MEIATQKETNRTKNITEFLDQLANINQNLTEVKAEFMNKPMDIGCKKKPEKVCL